MYVDAPGGTQVCGEAIEAMSRHLRGGTANAGGMFTTSQAVDALSRAAHEAVADLLGGEPDEVAFGANMTSLTFAVSRALARDWQAGDELVVTRLDHDANVAPHLAIDVKTLGCDLLAFSPYKLFGPHAGVLWCRRELADRLRADKVRPASTEGARRFETGTPSFEAQAGIVGMIEYLEWLGDTVSPGLATRRARLVAAFAACHAYESELGTALLEGLARFNSVRLYGPTDMAGRVPTFAFTVAGHSPTAVVGHLADRGIFAWAGHFYAVETIARLGLEQAGGLVRVGLCHYNSRAEVDRLLDALADLLD